MLEAQISGLPCVVSDKITREVDLGDLIWESIDDAPKQWAKAVLSVECRSEKERISYRENHLKTIRSYDITQSVKQLDKIYVALINGKGKEDMQCLHMKD